MDKFYLIINYLDEELTCKHNDFRYKYFMQSPYMMKSIKEISKKEYFNMPFGSKFTSFGWK